MRYITSPRLHPVLVDNAPHIAIPPPFQDASDELSSRGGIAGASLLARLGIAAESGGEKAGGDAPCFDAVFFEYAVPFWRVESVRLVNGLLEVGVTFARTSHHHVHTALAAAVGWDVALCAERRLWPACGGCLVDWEVGVFGSLEGGCAACHE